MTNVFLELCNRSIQAGYLILAIILLRFIWKRVSKLLYRYLWCLVGLRLILPFTLETALSLIPKKTVVELGEFRESIGCSRRVAVPILEHFDKTGFTVKTSEGRILK